jgi:hypothetical protein
MRYDIMNSELGPILFSRDDNGINRVHFLNSAKPLPRNESWRQTSQDPLLQQTRRQYDIKYCSAAVWACSRSIFETLIFPRSYSYLPKQAGFGKQIDWKQDQS